MMAKLEYLLTLFQIQDETIRLYKPNIIGYEPNGDPIIFDTLDARSFGQSFLANTGSNIAWHARTRRKSLDQLSVVYGFHCGAIVSPRAREIIEADDVPNVEFIPVEISYRDTGLVLGQWWFVNVFNWKDVFNFDKSVVEYEDFYQPITGLRNVSRQFGEKAITKIHVLEVNYDQIQDGLFLAKGPSERIWLNVFISKRLADKINEGVPKGRQSDFSWYWLDEGPGPKFDLTPYHYAGTNEHLTIKPR